LKPGENCKELNLAKLTIVAEIDLTDSREASDLLCSISNALEDMMDACEAGQSAKLANTSGVLKNDPEDAAEDPFGTWKWE
jgi:hypothetical protein